MVLLDAELNQAVVFVCGAQCFEPRVSVLALALSGGKRYVGEVLKAFLDERSDEAENLAVEGNAELVVC